MSRLSYDSFCCVQQMTIEEVAAHDEEIIHYILRHPELDANILYALRKHEVIRGMNKEQVKLVIGPPEKVVKEQDQREVWWYHVSKPPIDAYVQPAAWLRHLSHPEYISDMTQRVEIYFEEDIVRDIESYMFRFML